jgi:hypothetical protein
MGYDRLVNSMVIEEGGCLYRCNTKEYEDAIKDKLLEEETTVVYEMKK